MKFKIDEKKIKKYSKIISENKSWKKKKMNMNLIFDWMYENFISQFEIEVDKKVKRIKKKQLSKKENYYKILKYLNSLKEKINFNRWLSLYLSELEKQLWENWNIIAKSFREDLNMIFVNWVWDIKKNSFYIDDVLFYFFEYLNNTLFRNFIVLFIKKIREEKIDIEEEVLLDLLVYNRKINTILSIEIEKKENYLNEVLKDLSFKIYIKWSSLISNQLRFFWYRRIQFLRLKEQSYENQQFDLKNIKMKEQSKTMWAIKKKTLKEIEEDIWILFKQKDFFYEDIRQSICEIFLINFKSKKHLHLNFLEFLKKENKELFKKISFHINDLFKLFEEENEKKEEKVISK